jgi:hypothetical protein
VKQHQKVTDKKMPSSMLMILCVSPHLVLTKVSQSNPPAFFFSIVVLRQASL